MLSDGRSDLLHSRIDHPEIADDDRRNCFVAIRDRPDHCGIIRVVPNIAAYERDAAAFQPLM